MTGTDIYPVRVSADFDQPLSRWLWLVKWILVIPHFIVLTFLWLALVVLSAVALVSIVATGRYPARIFAGIVGTDVGITPFGYVTSMVVTIGLWLVLAPAIGAVAGKTPGKRGTSKEGCR